MRAEIFGPVMTMRTVAEVPQGGFRHSGHGKGLSLYVLGDYARAKHVMHNLEP